ncbi:MAG: response regulator [Lactobacillaceae bacterium]|nr:response regulator [Lactobacillaceae bacterium]
MNVFILEDKWIEQRYLEQTLRKIQTELKISEMNILPFTDVDSLMDKLPEPSIDNVFLLDIQIAGNKKAGLQVSQQIRQHDAFATIIFITVHDEFLPTTYKFKSEALDFIAKDHDNIADKLKDDFVFIIKKQHQQ